MDCGHHCHRKCCHPPPPPPPKCCHPPSTPTPTPTPPPSPLLCDKQYCKCRHTRRKRLCIGFILLLIIILLIVILLVRVILQPTKPRFILQDATVFAFNVSSPNILTSNIQVTISSRNPNDHIGIYYDRLDVYAVYRDQQITLRTNIPRTYQGHEEGDVWSPYVLGNCVPIAPYNGLALSNDQANGNVLVWIKIDGRVRWKVGAFISGKYHLNVKCPAYLTFGNPNTGIVVGNAVKYQLVQRCSVTV
ncbi:hypothetical protein L1049_027624 [Liquidambar formosana]|uniref:Late embryogenesis abundant protein LEA-2 subgroup domain-containing protein n=1 Tax=Liquidambar formosana TaxID=63359 RepID=A0AAP0WVA6_LIQFO